MAEAFDRFTGLGCLVAGAVTLFDVLRHGSALFTILSIWFFLEAWNKLWSNDS